MNAFPNAISNKLILNERRILCFQIKFCISTIIKNLLFLVEGGRGRAVGPFMQKSDLKKLISSKLFLGPPCKFIFIHIHFNSAILFFEHFH